MLKIIYVNTAKQIVNRNALQWRPVIDYSASYRPNPATRCNGHTLTSDLWPHSLLPPLSTSSQHYQLRQRTHDRDRGLPQRTARLTDSNFFTLIIRKDTILSAFSTVNSAHYIRSVTTVFCQIVFNKDLSTCIYLSVGSSGWFKKFTSRYAHL